MDSYMRMPRIACNADHFCNTTARNFKGHDNEADFLRFLQKLIPHESLTLPFEPFQFWLRIRGDIRIKKTTPRYHRYRETPTPRISDTGSRQLPAPLIFGLRSRQLPTSLIRGVRDSRITDTESLLLNLLKENSLYRWYGELSTPCTSDTVSCRLPRSLSRRVPILRVSPIWRATTLHIVESGSWRLCGSVRWGVAIQRKN